MTIKLFRCLLSLAFVAVAYENAAAILRQQDDVEPFKKMANVAPWTGKSDEHVCNMAGDTIYLKAWAEEAKRRGLPCDTNNNGVSLTATTNSTPPQNQEGPAESSYQAWLREMPAEASKYRVQKWCVPPNETTLGGEPYVDSNSPTWNRCKTGSGPKGTAVSYEAVKNFYSRKGNQSKLCNRVKHFDSYADALTATKSGANRTAVTYFILANDIQLSCDGNSNLPDDILTAKLTKKLEEILHQLQLEINIQLQ